MHRPPGNSGITHIISKKGRSRPQPTRESISHVLGLNGHNHEARSEEALWKAVLMQAFTDALGSAPRQEADKARRDARGWLLGVDNGLEDVCHLAGYNPDYIQRVAARLIAPKLEEETKLAELSHHWPTQTQARQALEKKRRLLEDAKNIMHGVRPLKPMLKSNRLSAMHFEKHGERARQAAHILPFITPKKGADA